MGKIHLSMNIVHLSYSDYEGGAAKAAFHLHQGLLTKNLSSTMLVKKKLTNDKNVIEVCSTGFSRFNYKFLWIIEKIILKILGKKSGEVFSLNIFKKWDMRKYPVIDRADIIILYWVGNGFLSPEQIEKIKAPIIWRFSDLWPMTGGCHYSGGCEQYQNGCLSCPQLGSARSIFNIPNFLFKKKMSTIANRNIIAVAPSSYTKEKIETSLIFKEKTLRLILTGVETSFFKPPQGFRQIKMGEKVRLLVGANNFNRDTRKGFLNICNIWEKFPDLRNHFELVIFGIEKNSFELEKLKEKGGVTQYGIVKDKNKLLELYHESHIFLCPSLEDNLPNIVLEAQATGLPVVGHNISGLKDIIYHGENGYLAKLNDLDDFYKGIYYFYNDKKYVEASLKSRELIETKFKREFQVENFISLFKEIKSCVG